MTENFSAIENLGSKDLARLIIDMLHRLILHHGFWFSEVRHQMGSDRAMEALEVLKPLLKRPVRDPEVRDLVERIRISGTSPGDSSESPAASPPRRSP